MNNNLVKVFSKLLRDTADKLDAHTCEINQQQAVDIIQIFSHEPLNKYQACKYLNMSRSQFDKLVLEGKLPRGRKKAGETSKFWYKDELTISE